jgi:hypothetical protein
MQSTLKYMPMSRRAYAPQPNCRFNADANSGHAFGIFLPAVCTLRPYRASGAG